MIRKSAYFGMLALLALAALFLGFYAPYSDLYVIFLGAGALLITKLAADVGSDKACIAISLAKPYKAVRWIDERPMLEAIYSILKDNSGCVNFSDLKKLLVALPDPKDLSMLEDEELRHFLTLQDSRLTLKFYKEWVLCPECVKGSIGSAAIRRIEGMAHAQEKLPRRTSFARAFVYSKADLGSCRKLRRRDGAKLLLLPGRNSSRKLADDVVLCKPVGLVSALLVCCRFAEVIYC